MLEPDAGFSIKHDKKPASPAMPPAESSLASTSSSVSTSVTPAKPVAPAPEPAVTPDPLPRPIFAELKKSLSSQPDPSANIQTIQTSDPNFVVTKNLDADSVFATAAPTASFGDLEKKPPVTPPTNEPPKPAIEISNPMAPRSLFEEVKPATPSVAFNDPAAAPDAPRPGTDPNAKKGIDKEDFKRLREKLNTPQLQTATTSVKTNPMRALLIVSAIIIVILIIAIALVS